MTTATKANPTAKARRPVATPVDAPKMSGLRLDSIGDLSGLLNASTVPSGGAGPMLLPIGLIDEDPNQPRHQDSPGFSPESLGELAETIRLRGVKTPISVRENPDVSGRYLINHGARRFRGSKLAGKTDIPGFIDNDYNEADQVIENLQRNDLTAREIADYIGRELAKGAKKGEIAKAIGKSPAFVTQHVTLLDLPDAIAKAFNSGRCRDVTVINELVTAHKRKPQEVADWLGDEGQEITRGSVKMLRDFLDEKRRHEEEQQDDTDGQAGAGADGDPEGESPNPKQKKEDKPADPGKLKKAIIQVKHDDRSARLLLSRRPPAEGFAWLKYEDDGHEFEANLAQVQLVAVLEG